jgi:Putative Ig domain
MASYPYWLTSPNLGTANTEQSFTKNNLVILFAETNNLPCTVSLLNGELPPGLTWQSSGYSVIIQGQIQYIPETLTYSWTFRANNGSVQSDRTFSLTVLHTTSQTFDWVTSNAQSLGFIGSSNPYEFVIEAIATPFQPVSYNITNLQNLTKGISIDQSLGTISVNLSWLPNTFYQAYYADTGYSDYVYNNNILYQCVVSGTSASAVGPVQNSAYVVDSDYAGWITSTFYQINDVVTNDGGKIYVCIRAGASSPSQPGPSGSSNNISDFDAAWTYVGQAGVWAAVGQGTDIQQILDCTATITVVGNNPSVPTTQTITNTYTLDILSQPYPPIWQTASGLIASAVSNEEFSYQLQATDPSNQPITWTSTNLPSWLSLSSTSGLLWGYTPVVAGNTTYSFDVTISDIHFPADTNPITQTFEILVEQTTVLFSWVTDSQLGTMPDGTISSIVLVAKTNRVNGSVTYGMTGGMLPPGMFVDPVSGGLRGFVEYHAQDHDYAFEITATDGVDTLTRVFYLRVVSQNLGFFWSFGLPILGNDRQNFITYNDSNIIATPDLFLNTDPGWGRVQNPIIIIASGVKRLNAITLRDILANYMHGFKIQFRDVRAKNYTNEPFSLIYLAVRDADSWYEWAPNTNYSAGSRVSNSEGLRYVAIQGGTSGSNQPRGTGVSITDNSVVWSYDSVPIPSISRNIALPWYADHNYDPGSTVVNDGNSFGAYTTTPGFSAGDLGPSGPDLAAKRAIFSGNLPVPTYTDNQVTWQLLNTNTGNSIYYPADIYNLRNILLNNCGFSSASGTGAQAEVTINGLTGGISSVIVTVRGNGYYSVPTPNIYGSGTGAVLQPYAGAIGVVCQSSDPGFSVNENITINLGGPQPVIVSVHTVDSLGIVTGLTIVQSGKFTQCPSAPVSVISNGRNIAILIDPGIVSVAVVNAGSGYNSSTRIDFLGQELDYHTHTKTNTYDMILPLGFISANQSAQVLSAAQANNWFTNSVFGVDQIQASVEGIQWQGHTAFEGDTLSFDSQYTSFTEYNSATETVWDISETINGIQYTNTEGFTIWDKKSTTFDRDNLIRWPAFGNTYFDNDHTLLDYYATYFDGNGPSYTSRYRQDYLWSMGKPFLP